MSFKPPMPDSPVERARRAGPCGNGKWPGIATVYKRIAAGCQKMAEDPSTYLSDDHVQAMADLGSGHEQRMKARQLWMIDRGYITI